MAPPGKKAQEKGFPFPVLLIIGWRVCTKGRFSGGGSSCSPEPFIPRYFLSPSKRAAAHEHGNNNNGHNDPKTDPLGRFSCSALPGPRLGGFSRKQRCRHFLTRLARRRFALFPRSPFVAHLFPGASYVPRFRPCFFPHGMEQAVRFNFPPTGRAVVCPAGRAAAFDIVIIPFPAGCAPNMSHIPFPFSYTRRFHRRQTS